jgi:hypothetical protein
MVNFIDCAGEVYQTRSLDLSETDGKPSSLSAKVWLTFEQTRVMVFCLPAWAAFPDHDMTDQRWAKRQTLLDGFKQVLFNYTQLRRRHGLRKTRIVVALTQADDEHFALRTLRERWIEAYVDHSDANLERLAQVSGPTRYLAAARAVSDYVRDEFKRVSDLSVRTLPDNLELEGEKPWFIPVTAVNGQTLQNMKSGDSDWPGDPVPAHVELPLLLALCDEHNILM